MAAALMLAGSAVAQELKVGDDAPAFEVKGVDGETYTLEELGKENKLVVVCFTCNNCPVAVAYEDRFIDFNKQFEGKDVTFVAINSNTSTESLDAMKERSEEKEFNFVYALDESGEAAASYGATVTPELFVIQDGKIAYHGAFDNEQEDPSEHYVVNAVTSLLDGKKPEVSETKPFGCGIKVKR
jgi:peroxiredoxin